MTHRFLWESCKSTYDDKKRKPYRISAAGFFVQMNCVGYYFIRIIFFVELKFPALI